MKPKKPYIIIGFVVLLLVIMIIFRFMLSGAETPLTTTESFSQSLWNIWGFSIVLVAFVIFAGGAGVLVLLGGGWRWE